MTSRFKEVCGAYYIGDDAETLIYFDKDQKTAYFQDSSKDGGNSIKVYECSVFQADFSSKFQFRDESFSNFTYLVKKSNFDKTSFESISYAFSDFLKKSECTTPILASFLFASKNQFIKFDNALKKLHYRYYEGDRYSFLPSFIYHCINKSYEDSNFLTSNIQIVTNCLKSLIQIILYECSSEIKTISSDILMIFNPLALPPLENYQRYLFFIVYYLLTNVNIEFNDDIFIDDIPTEHEFLKSLIFPRNKINYKNCYIFPAIFWVTSPGFLDTSYEYKFSEEPYNEIKKVFNFYNEKIKAKSFGFFRKKVDQNKVFTDDENHFKENLKSFSQTLMKMIIPKQNALRYPQNIQLISSFLESIVKEVKNLVTKFNEEYSIYPYEQLESNNRDVEAFDKRMKKLDFNSFWKLMNSDELLSIKFSTREDFVIYIKTRIFM